MIVDESQPVIAFLNYNTAELLIQNLSKCLESGIPAEQMLVLDNHSSDGSAEAVQRRFPHVRLISSGTNSGYAGGMNKLVEAARSRFVMLVTADCYITLETVSMLKHVMELRQNVAIAGCRVIDLRTGKVQSEGADITYPLGIPLTRKWQADPDSPPEIESEEVAFVGGSALLIDREKFTEIGGFDETYFAYHEDVDLCWRARLQGYRVVAVSSARAYHVTFGSFRASPTKRWLLSERNRIATNLKNLGQFNLLVALFYELLYGPALAVGSVVFGLHGYTSAYSQGILSLIHGLVGVVKQRRLVQARRRCPDEQVLRLHPTAGLLRLAPALGKRIRLFASLSDG